MLIIVPKSVSLIVHASVRSLACFPARVFTTGEGRLRQLREQNIAKRPVLPCNVGCFAACLKRMVLAVISYPILAERVEDRKKQSEDGASTAMTIVRPSVLQRSAIQKTPSWACRFRMGVQI